VPPKNILDEFRAPAWEPARSEFITLWHGTISSARKGIEAGIDLTACAVDRDFGRGFYTTTLERQARFWAREQFFSWQEKNPTATGERPVVLRFQVRRYSAKTVANKRDRGLDGLNFLDFIRGEFGNEDYWSLIQHCRSSIPKGWTGAAEETVHDHRRTPGGWYDEVAGPVAAFWEQRVVMADADQYSFHTPAAVEILDDLITAGKGKGVGRRGNPDYYRWEWAD
jgi:Protein of unknown function (DUF3990)